MIFLFIVQFWKWYLCWNHWYVMLFVTALPHTLTTSVSLIHFLPTLCLVIHWSTVIYPKYFLPVFLACGESGWGYIPSYHMLTAHIYSQLCSRISTIYPDCHVSVDGGSPEVFAPFMERKVSCDILVVWCLYSGSERKNWCYHLMMDIKGSHLWPNVSTCPPHYHTTLTW